MAHTHTGGNYACNNIYMLGRVSLCVRVCLCVLAKFIHHLSLYLQAEFKTLNAAHCAQHQPQHRKCRRVGEISN